MYKQVKIELQLIACLLMACGLFVGCADPDKAADKGDTDDGKVSPPTQANPAGKGNLNKSSSKPVLKDDEKPKIGFVTNGVANFWTIAKAGAEKAAADVNADVEVYMPATDGGRVNNQNNRINSMLVNEYNGIAVSPIDPENQHDVLDKIGEQTHFVIHDSDAPKTNRRVYIGMSNYDAGRMVGQLVKEAVGDKGNVVVFIGSQDQLNGRQRRQGVIDELLGRDHNAERYDKPGNELSENGYTILETYVDEFKDENKKQQPLSAIVKYGDKIDAMVGLFEYNPPFILDALRDNEMLGKVAVVGFDENEQTLQAIKDGHCIGTVVQNPYMYGYESVRILSELARGDESSVPENGYIDIAARKITKENVQSFWDELNSRLGK